VVTVSITGQSKIKDVTLITHDSFVMTKAQITSFEKESGYNLRLLKSGDAGSLTNRLILTKGAPIADVVFGIDNTFSSLATNNGIIDGDLTATDFGDVCFNYDKNWFASHKIPAPQKIMNLVEPQYMGLTVVENPKLSSTGLSFLAATVAELGESSWQTYWKGLKDNKVKVVNGWDSAYNTDFSGSAGKGKYPIVLSYSTSPADEVRSNGQSQTASILDGCFKQTEYAGVIKGAKNPEGAKAVVAYLLSTEFQKTFPDAMYVYPIVEGTPIPDSWSKFAPLPEKTFGDTLDFTTNRKGWLDAWSSIFA
jgi:thiamine transport system substrate-binding protein